MLAGVGLATTTRYSARMKFKSVDFSYVKLTTVRVTLGNHYWSGEFNNN